MLKIRLRCLGKSWKIAKNTLENLELYLVILEKVVSLVLNLKFFFFNLSFQEHTGRVFRLQFDDFQIISSSHDDTILIWDFLDGQQDGLARQA